jgi:hypothetical protein
MSDTMKIGKQLVELCKQGKHLEAVNTLYSPKIVSIEAVANPAFPARLEGLAAVREKNDWWMKNHEIHKAQVSGPWPHGDRFVVAYAYEVTPKAGPHAGQRFNMEEAALYTVENGKIVHEEFFYDMTGA